MLKLTAMIILLLNVAAFGQDLKLPDKIEGNPGDFLKIVAETKGEIVRWKALDPGLSLFPSEELKNPKTTVVMGLQKGTYRLIAWTAIDGVPTHDVQTLIVIGGDPNPPNPGPDPPGPDPTPNLSEVSKKVRDLAKSVGNKVEAKQVAENYATVISQIGAGAYDSLGFEEAKSKIGGDVFALNVKVTNENEEWRSKFFVPLQELAKGLDGQNKLSDIKQLKKFFQEIQVGLEAYTNE